MPEAITASSTSACRRPFLLGASWPALMAEFRTMCLTFARLAARIALEPIEGSRAEAGVSSQRMSTPSNASASVSGSSRSPATTSTPSFLSVSALAGSRTKALSRRPGFPFSAPSTAVETVPVAPVTKTVETLSAMSVISQWPEIVKLCTTAKECTCTSCATRAELSRSGGITARAATHGSSPEGTPSPTSSWTATGRKIRGGCDDRENRRGGRRGDRPPPTCQLLPRRHAGAGVRGGHDRVGHGSRRSHGHRSLVQVPPTQGTALYVRSVRELHGSRGRSAQPPGLPDAREGWDARAAPERPPIGRLRPAAGGRPVLGVLPPGLLLQVLLPAALHVAAGGTVHPPRRRHRRASGQRPGVA